MFLGHHNRRVQAWVKKQENSLLLVARKNKEKKGKVFAKFKHSF